MTKTTSRAALLINVTNAVFASGKSRAEEIAAVKKAGVKQVDVRETVIAARLALTLWPNANETHEMLLDKARAVIARPGATGKAKDRRTAAQEKAYGSARQYWSRLLKDAGVKSDAPQAKNANAGNKGKASPAVLDSDTPAKAERPASPGFANETEARIWINGQAAMMLATANKNGKVMSVAYQNAIKAFATAVNAATK